ncbi:MAG: hypothetical protein WD397_13860 [Wenzhouxiangellaceae bacterium]
MRTLLTTISIAAAAMFAVNAQADSDRGPAISVSTSGTGSAVSLGEKHELRRDSGPAGGLTAAPGTIELAFDAGSARVSAVQFLISADRDLSAGDISGCASNLPDTHVGGCKVKGENILFYAFSPINAALPSGVLGSISLGPAASGLTVEVSEPVMADVDGVEMTLD